MRNVSKLELDMIGGGLIGSDDPRMLLVKEDGLTQKDVFGAIGGVIGGIIGLLGGNVGSIALGGAGALAGQAVGAGTSAAGQAQQGLVWPEPLSSIGTATGNGGGGQSSGGGAIPGPL